jgi:hypothetical protein
MSIGKKVKVKEASSFSLLIFLKRTKKNIEHLKRLDSLMGGFFF